MKTLVSLESRRAKSQVIIGAVLALIGLAFGGYVAWLSAVSTEVDARVSRHEYDEHGHASLVIEFTDARGRVRELRTIPEGGAAPLDVGAALKVLVPPDGFDPAISQPGAHWFVVALWTGVGALLALLGWRELRRAKE